MVERRQKYFGKGKYNGIHFYNQKRNKMKKKKKLKSFYKYKLSDKYRTEFKCKFKKEAIEAFCGLLSSNFGFDLYTSTDFDLYTSTDWQGLESEVPADLKAIIRLLNNAEIDNEKCGLFIPFEFIVENNN